MALFSVTLREHTYSGRFYHDLVDAESCEAALHRAAAQATVPQAPAGSAPRSFSVTVREQACTGWFYHDVVEAESGEQALQLAAAQGTRLRLPDPWPPAAVAGRGNCDDVYVYSLLHCELMDGHEPPHMAVAHGYEHPVWWARDDRGIAYAVPEAAVSTA